MNQRGEWGGWRFRGWDPLAVSGKDLGVESNHILRVQGGKPGIPLPGYPIRYSWHPALKTPWNFKVVRFVHVFWHPDVTVATTLRTKTRPAWSDPTEDSLIAEKKATWESSTHGPHLGWNPENDSLNHPLKKNHMKTTNIWGKNLSTARRKQMVRGIPWQIMETLHQGCMAPMAGGYSWL